MAYKFLPDGLTTLMPPDFEFRTFPPPRSVCLPTRQEILVCPTIHSCGEKRMDAFPKSMRIKWNQSKIWTQNVKTISYCEIVSKNYLIHWEHICLRKLWFSHFKLHFISAIDYWVFLITCIYSFEETKTDIQSANKLS